MDKILKSAFIAAHIDRSKNGFGWELSPIALRTAKPLGGMAVLSAIGLNMQSPYLILKPKEW